MSWIRIVDPADAVAPLAEIYARVAGPDGHVDNVLTVHSLRPHTLVGHMTLYKNVLHHRGNTLPKWYLECIGVYVSHLNQCGYCVAHHLAGLARLLDDGARANALLTAMSAHRFEGLLDAKCAAGMIYVRRLTEAPALVAEHDIAALGAAGFDDGEILEINQVAAYFAYANRTVLGLGVTTDGDVIGLSPGDNADEGNWSHG
jgi:uncharacterized peroxidase-related enzyme